MTVIAAFTGGRDYHPSLSELEKLERKLKADRVSIIRHGDCPTGVDRTASAYLRDRGVCEVVDPWPANWKLGKSAGPRRNRAMLTGEGRLIDRGDVKTLYAFKGGRGTSGCVLIAIDLGIEVVEIEPVREPKPWNRHHGQAPGPSRYVGRGSVLGNPFRPEPGATADDAIELYRRWLWERMRISDPAVVGALQSLTPDHFLVCSCWPGRCHAEIVVRAWRWWQERTERVMAG